MQRMESELAIAYEVQTCSSRQVARALLIGCLRYLPSCALSQRDYYDLFPGERQAGAHMGDISGKGFRRAADGHSARLHCAYSMEPETVGTPEALGDEAIQYRSQHLLPGRRRASSRLSKVCDDTLTISFFAAPAREVRHPCFWVLRCGGVRADHYCNQHLPPIC